MNAKKCKLMFFVYVFGGGGAEKMILNILNNIDNKKYDITLVLGIRETNEYLDLLNNKNVLVDYIDVPLGNDDLAIKKLADKINEYNPDILFTEARYTNWLAYHAKRVSKNRKVKLIFREAAVRSASKQTSLIDKLKTFLHYNFGASHIVAISNGVKDDLHNVYRIRNKKITRVYNLIDLEKINALANEKIDNDIFNKKSGYKIISVGRLVPSKNQMMLIKAFEIVHRKNSDVFLYFLGRGPLEDELRRYCTDHNINNVFFLGFDINPYRYVKKSDLFVLTSNNEGFGNVITEAMAVGTPVISSDCPFGPREILDNGKYGILVKVDDTEELAISIEKMMKSKKVSKNYSTLAKQRVHDFEVHKIVKEYENVIDKVYGKK